MSAASGANAEENPVEEIVEDVINDDARESRRGRYGWLSLAVAAIFGLFFAFDLWEAIGSLFARYIQDTQLGLTVPWVPLVLNTIAPPLIFVAAFFLGRRHRVGGRVLLFLTGLAVVAALSLVVQSLVV